MPAQKQISRRQFIQDTGLGIGGAVVACSCGLLGCSRSEFDLIIEDGMVYDGSGAEPKQMDIGVLGDRIAVLGKLKNRTARSRLSAAGLAIAPGFIDIHTHTETELLIDPHAQSKVRQGVTTELAGQCGDSVAPLTAEMRASWHERLMREYGVPVDWTDFRGFYRRLQQNGMLTNWLTMVGQGTLREHVVGKDNRPATPVEISQMQQLTLTCFNQGVWGISSGLEYTPGSFATADEIAALCSVMSSEDKSRPSGIYATHMRNEDDTVEEALTEAITIAQQAGIALQVSHLKASGKRNWYKTPKLLQMLDEARRRGQRVTADRYPYIAYSTGLSALFPLWSREGGTEKFLARLQQSELLPKIQAEVQFKIDRLGDWHAVLISGVETEKNKWMQGKRIDDIAAQLQQAPFELTRQLLLEDQTHVSMCGFGMSEEDTKLILNHPAVAIGSDGSALATTGKLSTGHPHPRAFGTFPRVLGKYARDEQLFALAEAIRKMTSLPAGILGLPYRGLLKPGYFADLVIFDPQQIADVATYENPKQYPVGIPHVLVNGEWVILNSELTDRRPGKILLKV